MLPVAYQLPAAVILVAGGAVACFLGYRLFRFVLGLFGFILGALAVSSLFGESSQTAMVIAAILGGVGGALLLLAAYFVGVALIGAAIGALVTNAIWSQIPGDPHPFVVILFSIAGALLATWLQRYVIILATAFAGAWTMIIGGTALMGDSTALTAAAQGDVWVAYPMNPAPGQRWVPWAFLAMGAVGTLVQMWTGGDRARVGRRRRSRAKRGD